MTEWWVSTKKHFCEICKVWTGGHIRQINKHKEGRMHIEHEAKMLEDARVREKQRKKEGEDLKNELEEIERAAAAAMAKDTAVGGAFASSRGGGSALATASSEAQAAQRAQIQETVETAKRRRLEAAGVNPDAPPGSPWTRHTDPNSGVYYYYNAGAGQSSWTEPAEFASALAAAEAAAPPLAAAAPAAVVAPAIEAAPTMAAPAASSSGLPATGGPPSIPTSIPASVPVVGGLAPKALQQQQQQQQQQPRPKRPKFNEDAALEAASAALSQFCTPGDPGATPATSSSAPAGGAGRDAWVVCTDPNSGHVYYFNKITGRSSWTKPLELDVDLSKPPPPPSGKKPPPPPKKPDAAAVAAGVGAWEEVKPDESMWQNPEEARGPEEPDSDEEEQMPNPFAQVKESLMGRKGMWADEDLELREKEMFAGSSTGGGSPVGGGAASAARASVPSFPISRTRATGIRKRGGE